MSKINCNSQIDVQDFFACFSYYQISCYSLLKWMKEADLLKEYYSNQTKRPNWVLGPLHGQLTYPGWHLIDNINSFQFLDHMKFYNLLNIFYYYSGQVRLKRWIYKALSVLYKDFSLVLILNKQFVLWHNYRIHKKIPILFLTPVIIMLICRIRYM